MKRLLYLFTISFLIFNFLNQPAHGFTITPPAGVATVPHEAPGPAVSRIVSNVIGIFFVLGTIGVIIMVVWGAFDFIISGGDKDKMGSARKKITTALIGLALLALAFFLISLVGEVVGINPFAGLIIPFLGQPR